MKDKKDGGEQKEDLHRQIIPTVTDEAAEICEWLEGLFEISPKDTPPGEPKTGVDAMPQRIVLHAVYGAGGRDRGDEIDSKEWKPTSSPQPSEEQIVQLANGFLGRAQRHCDTMLVRDPALKRQRYCLFAYSTLKGPNAYAVHPFVLKPLGRRYERDSILPLASDDENTHRDHQLSTALAHNRWMFEHFTEAMTGLTKALLQDKKEQREEIRSLYAERREMIIAQEQALSLASDRRIKEERAQTFNNMLTDGWKTVRGMLPGAVAYATGGKVGIVEGLRQFLEGLSEQKRIALLGRWYMGECVERGVLSREQVELVGDIADGKTDPTRIAEFAMTLAPDQLEQAQGLLSQSEIQSLMVLVKAAQKARERNGAGEEAVS